MDDEPQQPTDSRYSGGMTAQQYRQALRRLSESSHDDEPPSGSPFATSPAAFDTPPTPTQSSRGADARSASAQSWPRSDAAPSSASSRPAAVSARLASATLPSTAAALQRLGRRTTAVMWVGVVLSVAALVTFVLAMVSRADAQDGGSPLSASLTDSVDVASMVASGLLGVWLLVGGVLFVVWLHRMYAQAVVLRPARFTWRSGWAVGGWFVPLLNLYLPYRLTADISRSVTDGVLASIKIWWTLLLLGVLLSVGVVGMGLDTRVANSLGGVLSLGAVTAHALLLCAGLAAASLVRAVSSGVVIATRRLAPAPNGDAGPRPR